MPKKSSKTAVINEYSKHHNIRRTAEALNMEWYEVKRVLDAQKVDLQYNGKGLRLLAA